MRQERHLFACSRSLSFFYEEFDPDLPGVRKDRAKFIWIPDDVNTEKDTNNDCFHTFHWETEDRNSIREGIVADTYNKYPKDDAQPLDKSNPNYSDLANSDLKVCTNCLPLAIIIQDIR